MSTQDFVPDVAYFVLKGDVNLPTNVCCSIFLFLIVLGSVTSV